MLKWIPRALAIVLLLIICVSVAGRIKTNRQLKAQYTERETYSGLQGQYQKQVPMEEMDFSAFNSLFPMALEGQEAVKISLPADLTYYRRVEGGKEAVMTLKKGTKVLAVHPDFKEILGYGISGFPTYEKGWRYAKAFLTEAGGETDRYYVKTKDLERAAAVFLDSSRYYQQRQRESGDSRPDFIFRMTRGIDTVLYENGLYFSPDLARPVWTFRQTCLAIAAAVLLIGSFLVKQGKKQPLHLSK